MIISMNKTIGTVCHMCGCVVCDEISPFHIMDDFELKCDLCGTKIIHVKKERKQKSYTLLQKCFLCGETHVSKISHKAMWNRKLFSFGCATSFYDMCYVGKDDEVKNSLNDLVTDLNEAAHDADDNHISTDNSEYIAMAFELIKTFLATGKIRCICNNERFIVRMTESGINISCGNCGSVCNIKCKTAEDIENLKKTDILLLRKD